MEPSNTFANGGNILANAYIRRSVVTFSTKMAPAGMASNGTIHDSRPVEFHYFCAHGWRDLSLFFER